MTQTALALALGVSNAVVTKWRGRGMPVDSPESAQAWLVNHRQKTGRPRGWSPLKAKVAAAGVAGVVAAVPIAEAPTVAQEAAAAPSPPAVQELAHPTRAGIPGPSPEELLRRLEQVERLTFKMLAEARSKGHPVIERECVKVHRDAAQNLLAARADWLAQAEHERSLVSGDWVRRAFAQHDGVLSSLVRTMPRSLAGRILPSDADFAEAELRRWVDEVFLKTMHATEVFHENEPDRSG